MRALFAFVAAFVAAAVLAPAAGAVPLVATDGTTLYRFDSATPGSLTPTPVMGLASGEKLVDLDLRPADGKVYGVGDAGSSDHGHLYSINLDTGQLTAVGVPFPVALNGNFVGLDFNPVPDRLRLVSDNEENWRLNPDTAMQVIDAPLTPAGNTVANAYTNNYGGATTTTLYDIDGGQLEMQGDPGGSPQSPNSGMHHTVGSLGLEIVGSTAGFDITSAGTAYASLTTGLLLGFTRLYTIDLQTGAATLVGDIGDTSVQMVGLTALPTPAVLSLGSDAVTVSEGDAATLTVNRADSGANTISVDYAITVGSASETDYTTSSDTLSWGPGDMTPRTITVPTVEDGAHEDAESFAVSLANPAGGATLGAPASTTVTIADDDPQPPPTLKLGGAKKQKLRKVRHKGLAITATVDTTCDLDGSVKRAGKKKRIGRPRGSLVAGKSSIGVKIKKKAARKLRRGQKLVVRATCSNASGKSRTAKRVVKLKR